MACTFNAASPARPRHGRCTLYFESTAFAALGTCAIEAGCIDLSSSGSSNSTCPDMAGRPLDEAWNVSSMAGPSGEATWYVVAGISADYDCLPCQSIRYTATGPDAADGAWQTRVPAPASAPGLPPVLRNTTYTLQQVAPGRAETSYELK